jgi:hypothetical protein
MRRPLGVPRSVDPMETITALTTTTVTALQSADTSSSDLVSTAGNLASVVAAVLAALALTGGVRAIWRRTLGRRSDQERRIGRLGIGARLSFYESVLGEPSMKVERVDLHSDHDVEDDSTPKRTPGAVRLFDRAFRRQHNAYREAIEDLMSLPTLDLHTWVLPDCFVQAYVDIETQTVEGFSVTQRSRRFHPTFQFPPNSGGWRFGRYGQDAFFSVKLGKTRLADFDPEGHEPSTFRLHTTPRNWFYADVHSFGNVGYYLAFITAASAVGQPKTDGGLIELAEALGYKLGPIRFTEDTRRELVNRRQVVRRGTAITTFAIMSSEVLAERIAWWGPHGDEVRTLLRPLY